MECTICGASVGLKTHDGLTLCAEHKATQAEAVQPLGAMRISAIEDSVQRLSEHILQQIGAVAINDGRIKDVNQQLYDFMHMTLWERIKWFFRGIR